MTDNSTPDPNFTASRRMRMIDAAVAETPLKMADPPPATRMWVTIQKLSRARDGYSRAKDHATRLMLADEISDLVTQLRTLADAVMEDVSESND